MRWFQRDEPQPKPKEEPIVIDGTLDLEPNYQAPDPDEPIDELGYYHGRRIPTRPVPVPRKRPGIW